MKSFQTPAGNNLENFSMRRDKGSFHMSTAAFSTARTAQRNENYNLNSNTQDQQQTLRNSKHY